MSDEKSREAELVEVRRQKARDLEALGVHPFGTARTFDESLDAPNTVDDLLRAAPEIGELPEEAGIAEDARVFDVAGRVIAIRDFGKGAFVRLRDRSLKETQLFLKRDVLPEVDWQTYKLVDLGDQVLAEGPQFKTRRGDRAIRAGRFTVLTKALRGLPDKFHGLADKEQRYRQRYLDLIATEEVRRAFVVRTRSVGFIRRFLDEKGFMEVETPMMHSLVSGAAAKPFATHHNALDLDLYMRIAPELFLKRLVVGGFEQVYEIGRNFRNEGLSPRHNPEFTMLEFYWGHHTYEDLMDLTEAMIVGLIGRLREEGLLPQSAAGKPLVVDYQGEPIDFTPPWPRLSMKQAILDHEDGITEADLADVDRLRKKALEIAGDDTEKHQAARRMVHGELIGFLFEELVEHRLHRPTFITGFPVEVSPLARRSDADPGITDRFELMIAGRELANAFNELNDPDDQRERFRRQVEAKAAGALETMDYDEDYVLALEQGMPPTAGEGIGIDRLVMLLTDAASIRDVILFPLLRPTDP